MSIIKKYKARVLIPLVLLAYMALGAWTIQSVTNYTMGDYETLLSEKALDLVHLASVKFTITDSEFEELKAIEYLESNEHPVNKQLAKLFDGNYSADVKEVYLLYRLSENEIKYSVPEEEVEYYEAPVGTPLDTVWLCGVAVNEAEKLKAINDETYYTDMFRYFIAKDKEIEAYNKRAVTGFIAKDNYYGVTFTAYAPIYTDTGKFAGVLGVDLYFESFMERFQSTKRLLRMVFLLPTIILSIIYLAVYIVRMRKSESEARTDGLSGLYNRRYFDKMLPELVMTAKEEKNPFAVLMIDIDCFKKYNDNYGHNAGDDVIRKVSTAIVAVLRKKQDVVCRYGGEEFVVMLPDTDEQGTMLVAEKILESVASLNIPHLYGTKSNRISISIGVFSAIPQDLSECKISEFVIKADKALYRAKENGRDRYELFKD